MHAGTEQLNGIFQALADPTRRAILRRLGQEAGGVSELAQPFDMALPSFMKHITALEQSGLIRTSKCRVRTCTLDKPTAPEDSHHQHLVAAPDPRLVAQERQRQSSRRTTATRPPRSSAAPASAQSSRLPQWCNIPHARQNRAPVNANTSSPTLNRVTALSIASISPANSVPRIGWRGPNIPNTGRANRAKPGGMIRLRALQSPLVTVVARIRTSTSLFLAPASPLRRVRRHRGCHSGR